MSRRVRTPDSCSQDFVFYLWNANISERAAITRDLAW